MTPRGRLACQRITPDRTGAHRNEPHSKSNEPCRTGHIQSQLPLAGSPLILAADASSHRLSLSGASPRASVLSSLSPAPHLAPPCYPYVYIYIRSLNMCILLSDGVRARLLIHACETTVTPAHDEPLEEQAARAPKKSGYARNGTLFPQVYRAAAPPFASKNSHSMVFFSPSFSAHPWAGGISRACSGGS